MTLRFDIDGALNTPGWMKEEELRWLAMQAAQHHTVCEVGSWMGRSTRAIADNLPEGGKVFAVDTWLGSDEPAHKEWLRGKPLHPDATKEGENWLLDRFLNSFPKSYFDAPYRVRPCQKTSLIAAKYLGNANGDGCYSYRFDMVFLDASHDYENVKADIAAWAPLVTPGGLLCGHDFGGIFPGVEKAVLEVYPQARKVGAGSIWAVTL